MFSFWESIAAQFQTFILHGEQTLLEKDSPSSRTTKSSFFRRSINFGNVPFFLVGATNIFSELIQPLLKLLNFVLKQKPHILQLSEVLRSFGFLPLSGAGTGFVSILPLPLIFDLPENKTLYGKTSLKTALELLDTPFTTRSEAKA